MIDLAKTNYHNNDELLRIEDKCNEHCLYCNVNYKGKDFVYRNLEYYKKKIKEYKKNGVKVVALTGGEPTLNKNLFKIIAMINSAGLAVSLQTNATLIDDKMAKKIKVNGVLNCFTTLLTNNPDKHNKLKQKDSFAQTINGIKALLANNVSVVINILVTQENYKDIPALIEFIDTEMPKIKEVSLNFIQPHARALENKSLVSNYLNIKKDIIKIFKTLKKCNIIFGNAYCGLPLCIWQSAYTDLLESSEFIQNNLLRDQSNAKIQTQAGIIMQEKKHRLDCFNCYLKNFCNGYWRELDLIFPREKFLEPKYISYKIFD